MKKISVFLIMSVFSLVLFFNFFTVSIGHASGQPPETAKKSDFKGDPDPGSSALSLPSIHVVLEWEWLPNGENLARKNYQAKVDACKGSGMPFRALSRDDEDRLGKGEVDILIDSHHQSSKEISWNMGAEGEDGQHACLITLVENNDVNDVDNAADEGMYHPIDSDARLQNLQIVQSAGWKMTGEKQIKGIPCTGWTNGKQEVCMWSGGLKWGFDDSPMDTAGCSVSTAGDFLASLPVEAKPLNGASGCVFKIKKFNLDKS